MSRPPKYRKQPGRGDRPDRAFVEVEGKRVYLGVYGTEESRVEYCRVLTQLEGGGVDTPQPAPAVSSDPTISELILAYLGHVQGYYRHKDGSPTSEQPIRRKILSRLRKFAGSERASDFGPLRLEAFRDHVIEIGEAKASTKDAKASAKSGYTRHYVNRHVKTVKDMARYCVSKQLVTADFSVRLATVSDLQAGRTDCREMRNIAGVDKATVDATIAHLPTVVADMVRLHWECGARPDEICSITPGQVDRSNEVWIYRPAHHKTAYRNKARVIVLNARARAILAPYLDRADDAFCFSPAESEAQRRKAQHAARKTPLSCGNRPRGPRTDLKDRYTADSYRRCVERAAKRAKVPAWKPNQLRHALAERLRELVAGGAGLDAAQALLGHGDRRTTERYYAQLKEQAAIDAAKHLE